MISIQSLTKCYGNVLAIDKLSVEIPKGEILGLLGPNGAGKSTTLRVMTGYLSPTSGTIIVDGHDVTQEPRAVKERMGYLPESAPLYSEMIVFDYLRYIADIRGVESSMARLKGTGRALQYR